MLNSYGVYRELFLLSRVDLFIEIEIPERTRTSEEFNIEKNCDLNTEELHCQEAGSDRDD
jgi:hypothetical protein